jgi:hypothetical protein
VEKTDTFCRAIGQTTDIVEKEMYTWTDSNGDLLSLRPDIAKLNNKLGVFYYERPLHKYESSSKRHFSPT